MCVCVCVCWRERGSEEKEKERLYMTVNLVIFLKNSTDQTWLKHPDLLSLMLHFWANQRQILAKKSSMPSVHAAINFAHSEKTASHIFTLYCQNKLRLIS